MKYLHQKVLLPIFILILILANLYLSYSISNTRSPFMEVVFLDVGQGDAILIKTPSGRNVLIDAGSGNVLKSLENALPFYINYLDMVVATHPDKDHIGGFKEVYGKYDIGLIYNPDTYYQKKTATVKLYNNAKERELFYGAKEILLKRGDVISLGDGVYVLVLFPEAGLNFKESNNSSLVLKIIYGNTSFLFTGDAPQGVERILTYVDKDKLKSNVLKLGHHGSKYSSWGKFLETVKPDWAVISAGRNNKYKHPHKEVIDLLDELNIKYVSTSKMGNISFFSNGEYVSVGK